MSTIINATTTNGVVIQPDNSGSLQLATNSGTTALTIDTSQNVGIGTSSPSFRLNVQGSSDTVTLVKSTSGTNGAALLYLQGSDNSTYSAYNSFKSLNSDGTQQWYIGGNGIANTITFQTSTTERMRIDSSGNLLFNSGYGSVATAYGCRAWVNFNGTGTVAIRASGNVTSITDNGTGDYTVNFTTAMPDVNYATVGTSNTAANTGKVVMWSGGTAPTVSLVRIFNDIASNLTGQDSSIMNIAVFR